MNVLQRSESGGRCYKRRNYRGNTKSSNRGRDKKTFNGIVSGAISGITDGLGVKNYIGGGISGAVGGFLSAHYKNQGVGRSTRNVLVSTMTGVAQGAFGNQFDELTVGVADPKKLIDVSVKGFAKYTGNAIDFGIGFVGGIFA